MLDSIFSDSLCIYFLFYEFVDIISKKSASEGVEVKAETCASADR